MFSWLTSWFRRSTEPERPMQIRIDGRWRDVELPNATELRDGYLRYGMCGIIKPENWRYKADD